MRPAFKLRHHSEVGGTPHALTSEIKDFTTKPRHHSEVGGTPHALTSEIKDFTTKPT